MDITKIPSPPTDMTLPGNDKRIPVGSIRIDHSDDNFKEYSDIATNNDLGDIVHTPLWFNFLDNEYGIQDNYQHQYDEIRPYMRSEPYRYYAGSINEYIEFMLRFFAVSSAKDDVHRNYEFLTTLQYPWVDTNSGYKYPPPRLALAVNLSLIRVGFITAMNTTWYSPVGHEADLIYTDVRNKTERKFSALVYYYCECLITFTVVGTYYGGNSFRDIPSGNQRINNLRIGGLGR